MPAAFCFSPASLCGSRSHLEPFVAQAEIKQAFADYRAGLF